MNVNATNVEIRSELVQTWQRLNELVLGKEHQIKLALSCLFANGHLLIDDLPGMGKTVLSHALAKVLGLDYKRVQFTNDLIPADILGGSVYDKDKGAFRFVEGPIFCQLLLADEVNRASSKTQSALLEAMEERQVSLDGNTRPLPQPFFVIATQNPLEQAGTVALPESQLDRFMMCLSMGYPSAASELSIFKGESRRALLAEQQPLLRPEDLMRYQAEASQVPSSDLVLNYLYALLQHTRESGLFVAGLSTRAGLAILHAAKAWAWVSGAKVLLPDHVQAVFPYVAAHRLHWREGNAVSEASARDLLTHVDVPR